MPETTSEQAHQTQDSPTEIHPVIPKPKEHAESPTILQNPDAQQNPAKPIDQIRVYLPWSIINLIFIPFGIVCCYFSRRVRRYKENNQYILATLWSKRTLVINVTTTVLIFAVAITIGMLLFDRSKRVQIEKLNVNRTTPAFIPWQPGR